MQSYICTEYCDDAALSTWTMSFDGTSDDLLDLIEYQRQDNINIYGMYYTVEPA